MQRMRTGACWEGGKVDLCMQANASCLQSDGRWEEGAASAAVTMHSAWCCRSHLRITLASRQNEIISLQNAPIPLVGQSTRHISPRTATPRCCFIRISPRIVIVAQLHVAPAAQQQRAHAKDGITTLARKAHAAAFEDRGSKRCSRIAVALLEPRSTKKSMFC